MRRETAMRGDRDTRGDSRLGCPAERSSTGLKLWLKWELRKAR
jgi:hypothetical protein